MHGTGLPALHPTGRALGQQQVDDALGRVVAEQLAAMLLVEADAVAPHQRNEILRHETRQRRATEVGVLRQKAAGVAIAIGKVAAAAAGDADLLGHLVGVVEQQHAQASLAGDAGAQQTGRARPQHDDVELMHESALSAARPGWGQRPDVVQSSLRRI